MSDKISIDETALPEDPDPTGTRGLEQPTLWGIIVAAGRSSRVGSSVRKQFRPVLGRPLLAWTLESLLVIREIPGVTLSGIVLVLPPDEIETGRKKALEGIEAHQLDSLEIRTVGGGLDRSDSVRAGLLCVDPQTSWVLVHDGARPRPGRRLLVRLIEAIRDVPAVVPGLRPTDTIKRVDEKGTVLETLDRDFIRTIQTPQLFHHDVFRTVLDALTEDRPCGKESLFTDCASMMEAGGHPPLVIEGDSGNIKVTTERDFELIENLLRG